MPVLPRPALMPSVNENNNPDSRWFSLAVEGAVELVLALLSTLLDGISSL